VLAPSDGLGYACSLDVDPTLRFYYTISNASGIAPPPNQCTSGASTNTQSVASSPVAGANGWLHAAISGPEYNGWVALGFVDSADKMYPASAIQGGIDGDGSKCV
jgi:hypothetical protein